MSFSAQAQEKSKIRCIEGAGNNRYTYEKWLERDALYIITPEERQASLDLKTDAEREQFVELFWQRRDPNPETEINEFKEAYYERIAYVNEHLSSVAAAGWKTDRGRIYIIYGKPDSVATKFDEKETKVRIEEWHYRYPDGSGGGGEFKFVFVDVKGDGNFLLTNDAQLISR
ncbi:MAG: GWxTD domain-containing protein [Acidobacteriota bacterium]|nr:GWxTD domain-containing protein [Acidobacteriota bacterium]